MAKPTIDYTAMSLEELGDRFEIVDPPTIGSVNNLCRIYKELARRLREAEAERTAAFDYLNDGGIETAPIDMPLTDFIRTRAVRVWEYNEQADKITRVRESLHSALALIDNGDAHKARSVIDEALGEMEENT